MNLQYLINESSSWFQFQVWYDATIQVIFSYGICTGLVNTLASYNTFRKNVFLWVLLSFSNLCGKFHFAWAFRWICTRYISVPNLLKLSPDRRTGYLQMLSACMKNGPPTYYCNEVHTHQNIKTGFWLWFTKVAISPLVVVRFEK